MTKHESEGQSTLEPSTPQEMLSILAKNIKGNDQITLLPGFLANAYIEWAGTLDSLAVYDRSRGVIVDLERPLFAFFCAQLRVEEAEITPAQESLVFTEVMSRSKPRSL